MGFLKVGVKITAFVTENVTDDLYLPVTIGAKLMFLVLIFLVVDFISILFWKYFSKFLVKILGSKSILKEIYKQKLGVLWLIFSLYYFVFLSMKIFLEDILEPTFTPKE
jgi:hypothetical protein